MSEAFRGRRHSEESKRKISKAAKGRRHSEESKRKMSESSKGQLPWNTGKKLSEEMKRKMSRKQAEVWKRRKERKTLSL